MKNLHLLRAAAAAVVAVIALVGCEAAVTTDVNVSGPGKADVSVVVTFTDEAAAAIDSGSEADTQLRQLFAARGAPTVERSVSDDKVRYRVSGLDPTAVGAASEVTGVASIAVTRGEGDATMLAVEVVNPTKLAELLATYDAEAAGVLAAQTWIEVRVRAGGGIDVASFPSSTESLVLDDTTATLRQNVAEFEPGTLSVNGRHGNGVPWLAVAGGVLVLAAMVLAVVRRRNLRAAAGSDRRV
jgi:hypothetical protein